MAIRNGQSNSRSLLLLLLTSGFFITGLLFDYMPLLVDNQIKRTVELATNEEIQSLWSKPPIDVQSYFWLYDALNVNDFLMGQKLKVRKVGPFHFTSRPEKRIIELSQNKFRLTYNSTRHMRFNETDRDLSTRLNERLTLLNPVYATLISATKEFGSKMDADPETRRMMTASASRLAERFNETLFLNITAREALLGRKLLFLEKARKMLDTFGIEGEAAAGMASLPADNVFGYLAVMNNTWMGPYEVYTGYQASMPSLGDLISFKGKRRLTEFRGRCNRLQASAGELRPMPLEADKRLEMFQPNFCRIVHLRPTGQRKLREGLAYSYVFAEEDLLSARLNPDNLCYCLNRTADDYCSLNGVLELAPCSSFSPLILAMSHIEIDPNITSSLNNWDSELIESSLELQPPPDNKAQLLILKRIGVPIHLDLTYVLFMRVKRDSQFRDAISVPEVSYVPAIMVREMVSIPPKLGQILVNLESFLDLTQHLKVIMYLSAIVLLCWLTGSFYSGASRPAGRTESRRGPLSGLSSASANSSLADDREANSADSNRSQPPSRRSSLMAEPISSAERTTDEEPTSARRRSVLAPAGEPSLAPSKGAAGTTAPERLKRGKAIAAPKLTSARIGLAEGDSVSVAAELDPPSGTHSRGWFKKVCSSFVRILSGIRGVNEASQTEAALEERDRQLEMLAGKIDNWYSGGVESLQSDSPTRPEAPAEAQQSGKQSPAERTKSTPAKADAGQVNGGFSEPRPEELEPPEASEGGASDKTNGGPAETDLGARSASATNEAESVERINELHVGERQSNQEDKTVNKNTDDTSADESLAEDNHEPAGQREQQLAASRFESAGSLAGALDSRKTHSDKADALERIEAVLIA